MTESAYDIALKAAQHQALEQAVTDGRITPAQKAISADVLDGKITDEEAAKRYEALVPKPAPEDADGGQMVPPDPNMATPDKD